MELYDPDFDLRTQTVWDPEETYDCPLGFRWMSTAEAHKVFVGTIALEGYSEEPFTYFDQCGWRGYEWGGQIRKYFRFSDSKTTGAFKHAGFRDSYRVDTGFQTDLFAGIICYREPPAHQVTWGTQLWATDGTATGTQRIARISTSPEGSGPSHFAELNQRLFFQASSTDFGSELWSTDGTRDGTYLVADVEFGSRSSEPQFLIAFDSRVFFSAKAQDYGRELWFSDGNPRSDFNEDQHATVGTDMLFDICLGSKSSSPQHLAVLSPLLGSPLLLFQADDCIHGPELWSTDGTRIGTNLVLDIHKGSTGSLPVYLTPFAGKVYFQADDGTHGAELWTTDGSSSGTAMLVDISPGILGSRPSFFTVLESISASPGVLIFAAQAERDILTEFWQSDGTATGTTKVFPQSHEVVEINTDSMDLQLVGHKLVSISSWPGSFFFLGRQSGQGIDFQREAADHTEDIAQMRSITLQDIESLQNKRELTVSLNCSKGWISFGRQCDGVSLSLRGALDKEKPAVVTLKGSLNALNCAVEKVTYHSKPQENGWDEIHVTLSQVVSSEDGGSSDAIDDTERDNSYTVSKRMLVEIRAINDPPIITMGSTFYAPLRQWVVLGEIKIDDPDADNGMLYVSISVRNGRLRTTLVPPTSSRGPAILHATVDGDALQMLEFAATVEQAKVIFASLEYSCDDRFGCSNAQRDYVTVHIDDNGFTGSHGPQVTTQTAEILVMQEADA
ncbi:hypothetical protein KRP22_015093 [Phytophthora ramorum]|nr:hypothetical protein KRP22_4875 [Phytophthora ramorum]